MIINHNTAALNTYNRLSANNAASSQSLEKLSSGRRINRASDDAAGLAISEKMRSQIRGLNQASRNAQDGISMLQSAEGSLNETHSILQRMNELATQSSSGTYTDKDRKKMQDEFNQLVEDIDRISNNTEFNTQKLLNGDQAKKDDIAFKITGIAYTAATETTPASVKFKDSAGADQKFELKDGKYEGELTINEQKVKVSFAVDGTTIKGATATYAGKENQLTIAANAVDMKISAGTGPAVIQIGANKDQNLSIEIHDMGAKALGITDKDGKALVSIDTREHANDALDKIKEAVQKVSDERSLMGALQNRLSHAINNLNTSSENLSAAESRIRDVDMAKEMMEFQKNNILGQAATAMLAQANQQPQQVLQLLR